MNGDKPETAFISSLIGGVLVLVDGTLGFMLAVRYGSWPLWLWEFQDSELVLGPLGILLGIVIIIACTMAYSKRTHMNVWGMIIVTSSILSFFLILGGYIAGFVLGLVGGILFIVWEPAEKKRCLRCGQQIRVDSVFCPYCGMCYTPGLFYWPGQTPAQQTQRGGTETAQAAPTKQASAIQSAGGPGTCAKCGAMLLQGATFCASCGERAR